MNHLPEELFELINQSSYETLSREDKTMVSKYLTREEYEDLHQFLGDFSKADESLDNSIKIREEIGGIPLWRKLITYRMPLYKVAALYLLLAGSYFLYQQNTETIPVHNVMDKKVSIDEGVYPEDLIFEL